MQRCAFESANRLEGGRDALAALQSNQNPSWASRSMLDRCTRHRSLRRGPGHLDAIRALRLVNDEARSTLPIHRTLRHLKISLDRHVGGNRSRRAFVISARTSLYKQEAWDALISPLTRTAFFPSPAVVSPCGTHEGSIRLTALAAKACERRREGTIRDESDRRPPAIAAGEETRMGSMVQQVGLPPTRMGPVGSHVVARPSPFPRPIFQRIDESPRRWDSNVGAEPKVAQIRNSPALGIGRRYRLSGGRIRMENPPPTEKPKRFFSTGPGWRWVALQAGRGARRGIERESKAVSVLEDLLVFVVFLTIV